MIQPSLKPPGLDILIQGIVIRTIGFYYSIKAVIVVNIKGMGNFMIDDGIADGGLIGKETVIEFELMLGREANAVIG
jgi:hypothetical protein